MWPPIQLVEPCISLLCKETVFFVCVCVCKLECLLGVRYADSIFLCMMVQVSDGIAGQYEDGA